MIKVGNKVIVISNDSPYEIRNFLGYEKLNPVWKDRMAVAVTERDGQKFYGGKILLWSQELEQKLSLLSPKEQWIFVIKNKL